MSQRRENGRMDGPDGGSLTLGGVTSQQLSGNLPETDASGSFKYLGPDKGSAFHGLMSA